MANERLKSSARKNCGEDKKARGPSFLALTSPFGILDARSRRSPGAKERITRSLLNLVGLNILGEGASSKFRQSKKELV